MEIRIDHYFQMDRSGFTTETTFSRCPGCEGNVNPCSEDHRHQFINFYGDVVTVVLIDGLTYRHTNDAINAVAELYETDRDSAFKYIRDIPLKIN